MEPEDLELRRKKAPNIDKVRFTGDDDDDYNDDDYIKTSMVVVTNPRKTFFCAACGVNKLPTNCFRCLLCCRHHPS